MDENSLLLKSINQLFEYNFLIPPYQRGYRWTTTQVTQLLEDIWQFATQPPRHEIGKEEPFYCLQPIVVEKTNDSDDWEVIDGQQRLTTIFLILNNLQSQIERDLKNIKRIHYDTRPGSEDFLRKIDPELAEKNIDFFHINEANKCINKWFQDKANNSDYASPRAIFAPTFLSKTKVIWYEITDKNTDPIDIFTRINIGKIPLTNAELIKALFLQKDNFSKYSAHLRQVQIATEWDIIEKALQSERFWYFIYNPENPLKYENRIEFIFDTKCNRTKDDEFYHTFLEFQSELSDLKSKSADYLDEYWLSIKQYYLRLDEWYADHELYHFIGFLIACGINVQTLLKESQGKSKKEFTLFLKIEISKQIKLKPDASLEDIEYSDRQLAKKILLLFNIQTIINSTDKSLKFPFHKYKKDSWDIEHVRSLTEREITAEKRKDWAKDLLEYFTGERDASVKLSDDLDEQEFQFCKDLIEIINSEAVSPEKFEKIYDESIIHFMEDKMPDNINSLSNLALLDSATNRSYKNAMFPIKRNRIIANDKSGEFVPICTKNLFLKYYSKQMGDVLYWRESDADEYMTSIKLTLDQYYKPLKTAQNEQQ